MKTVFLWLALSSFSVTNALPVFAQQQPTSTPPPQDETIRVGTAAVQLDVIVTEKSGQRARGLTAADFEVRDEGQPRTVDYFIAIDRSQVVAKTDRAASSGNDAKTDARDSGASPLITPYQGRHIALVFDDLSLSPDNFLRARRALTDYVNDKLTPNDMAAVVSTGGALGSLQQFTNDKWRLLTAISRIASRGTSAERFRDRRFNLTPAEAVRIDSGDETVLNVVVQRVSTESLSNQLASTSNLAGGAPGSDTARRADLDALKQQVRGAARTLVAQSGLSIRTVLGTLKNLFQGMAELPGRKIVVLLTESLSTLGMSNEDVSNQLVQLAEVARRSGISIYALDAGGLRTKNTLASEEITGAGLQLRNTTPELVFTDFENLGAARTLTVATGGQLFANTNDIGAGLERAVEDSSSYYVVGFKPTALDNKFHRIAVSVKGKPELIVRTRRGYLAVNQETVKGTEAELLDALMRSPVPRIDLPLEIVANVVPLRGEQVVHVGLHVGRNYLSLPDTNAADQTTSYEVVSYVFQSGNDKPLGGIVRTVTYDLAKEPQARQKLKTEGFLLLKEYTQLPPGSYQVRSVIREKRTGAVGSAFQFFDVPDLNNKKIPSLSSIVLTSAGQISFGGHNTFKRGAEIEMRYVVYNLPKDEAEVVQKVKLIDAQGRVLMDSALALASTPGGTDSSQMPQGTRLNAPSARGRYALIVSLRDTKGRVDLERRADFVVE